MAPVTVFVKIQGKLVLPIKIHINRKSILSSHLSNNKNSKNVIFESTISSKNLIKLRKAPRIIMSNNDMKYLVNNVIKKELLAILFNDAAQDNESHTTNYDSDSINLLITKKNWKLNLNIKKGLLSTLRMILNVHSALDDLCLDRIDPSVINSSYNLLQKTSHREFVTKIDIDSDPEAEPAEETKSAVHFKYNNLFVFSKGIDLYVLQKEL
ncbi:DNA-binding protein SAW1 ASCRUDRAFT_68187 [Ascoidea rubescens DSM 1968]|uniref:Uncharacterized protein n=1 Tax=Ascoidea rubescens DSM 1968 TaxID=1344418 RepID=A0A1D2VRF0_9ASCO|nr:hypothetical protein ASCRUDRAFT_68187 [Ascoidea rubescens DSM 1968]ODV64169.1 hypothetical protein ASCRUDRAFT_68187 [Ascoidea rubescens DSM 1968]